VSDERARHVSRGRELEGQGKLDEAVAEYVKGGSAVDAARAYATYGRLVDAASAILRALDVELANAASAPAEHHDMIKQAAMLYEKGGEAERAKQLLTALAQAKTEPPPANVPSAPPAYIPSPPPPRPPSVPPARPATASVPGAMRPPVQTSRAAMSSASFRRPERPPESESVASLRPAKSLRPSSSSGMSTVPRVDPPRADPKPSSSAAMPTVPRVDPPRADPKPSSSAAMPTVPRVDPPRADVKGSAPAVPRPDPRLSPAAEAPRADVKPPSKPMAVVSRHEPRLGAGGEVVTEYSGSREAGWREEGAAASIDELIKQNIESGKKGAAARIAWDAGRFEQALVWFRELELYYQVGACLRALGRHEEALTELMKVGPGPHYRKACLELVPAAVALAQLDIEVDRYLASFVDEGPREKEDVPVFIALARLYRDVVSRDSARRVAGKVLAFDAGNAEAKELRAELDVKRAPSSLPPSESARGLPPLPTLDEFVKLARKHAPKTVR
jgi:hypothetical protein